MQQMISADWLSEAKEKQGNAWSMTEQLKFLVAMRIGDTPVLISNTMVKTYTADDTTLETAWESRWLPD